MKPLFIALFLVIMSFTAAYFLESGITGEVISERCCYGPDCAIETRCFGESVEQPTAFGSASRIFAGLFMVAFVAFLLVKKNGVPKLKA